MRVPEDVSNTTFHERFPNHNEAHQAAMEASWSSRPFTLIFFHNGECKCQGSYDLHKLRGLL